MKTKSILLRQIQIDSAKHKTISIVGAGGKTSLLKRLRDELVAKGLKVIVTTSTHILHEPDVPFTEGKNADEVKSLLDKHGYLVCGIAGEEDKNGRVKLSSPGVDRLDLLRKLCDVMLIEADGARGMLIKVPMGHEPVIYPWSDMVIAVASARAIGLRISDAAYRAEEFADYIGKDTGDIIIPEDILRIAASEDALRKGVGSKDYRFFLNAADESMTDASELCRIMQRLRNDEGIIASCGSIRCADDMGAVILGAGLGKRFGEENKLEQTIDGKAIYRYVLDEMAEVFGYESITFVTSHESIARAARETGANVVINEHPEDGQSSSVKLGLLANIHKGSTVFAVADQPFINRDSILALTRGFTDSDKGLASMAGGDGEFANPCIFSSAYYPDLLGISGDRGGKSIIKNHSDDVYVYVPARTEELKDIDTKEELEEMLR